ncbi:MAG: hypothetical protein QNJ01_04470 [Desulfobacterales bacterium]|nr:hypothetical protein [Desulfobacterales bacterium]
MIDEIKDLLGCAHFLNGGTDSRGNRLGLGIISYSRIDKDMLNLIQEVFDIHVVALFLWVGAIWPQRYHSIPS